MSFRSAVIEFSSARASADEILESVCSGSVRLVDSQQKHGMDLPMPVTLKCGGDRVVLEGADKDHLDVFLTPSSTVQRRFAASHQNGGSWGVDFVAMGGMTWSLRVELESEDKATFIERSLRDAQQRVVDSLHTAIACPASVALTDLWYPTLEPSSSSQMESSNGHFVLGGYVVVSHCKRMNHPVMLHASEAPKPACFRMMWAEMRVSSTDREVDVKCYLYHGHERVTRKELICVTTFSPDIEEMEIQGNVLILRGAEPRGGARDPSEVPGDEYLCFRCESEARLWNEVAKTCFEQGPGAFTNGQQQHVARSVFDASLAEMVAHQLLPNRPKEPMLARTEERALSEREAQTQPTDSIARAMQEVGPDTEEIARMCRSDMLIGWTVED